MIKCPGCGFENDDTTIFCGWCGDELSSAIYADSGDEIERAPLPSEWMDEQPKLIEETGPDLRGAVRLMEAREYCEAEVELRAKLKLCPSSQNAKTLLEEIRRRKKRIKQIHKRARKGQARRRAMTFGTDHVRHLFNPFWWTNPRTDGNAVVAVGMVMLLHLLIGAVFIVTTVLRDDGFNTTDIEDMPETQQLLEPAALEVNTPGQGALSTLDSADSVYRQVSARYDELSCRFYSTEEERAQILSEREDVTKELTGLIESIQVARGELVVLGESLEQQLRDRLSAQNLPAGRIEQEMRNSPGISRCALYTRNLFPGLRVRIQQLRGSILMANE